MEGVGATPYYFPFYLDARWRYYYVTYDTLDRLSTKTAPSEPTATYSYDLAGRMIGATGSNPGAPASQCQRSDGCHIFECDLKRRHHLSRE